MSQEQRTTWTPEEDALLRQLLEATIKHLQESGRCWDWVSFGELAEGYGLVRTQMQIYQRCYRSNPECLKEIRRLRTSNQPAFMAASVPEIPFTHQLDKVPTDDDALLPADLQPSPPGSPLPYLLDSAYEDACFQFGVSTTSSVSALASSLPSSSSSSTFSSSSSSSSIVNPTIRKARSPASWLRRSIEDHQQSDTSRTEEKQKKAKRQEKKKQMRKRKDKQSEESATSASEPPANNPTAKTTSRAQKEDHAKPEDLNSTIATFEPALRARSPASWIRRVDRSSTDLHEQSNTPETPDPVALESKKSVNRQTPPAKRTQASRSNSVKKDQKSSSTSPNKRAKSMRFPTTPILLTSSQLTTQEVELMRAIRDQIWEIRASLLAGEQPC